MSAGSWYLDKTVMECQLPELVVCYKDSTYHFVKDICIDEGVPTQDKFLFDSGVDEKSDCYFPQSEKDQDFKPMKDRSAIDMLLQDVSLSPEENQPGKDINNECSSNKEHGTDTSMRDVPLSREENESNKGIPKQCDSKEWFILGDILSLPELTAVKSKAMSTDRRSDGIEHQFFENPNKIEEVVVYAVRESNNPSEEATNSGKGEAIPSIGNGNGESSFSAAGPVTGRISYSGPIAYSGNLSHRSDSSTTSNCSFAFPILQSEWNSSPVRMTKADRRQYRKRRGWRHSFLCCKF